MARSRFAGRVCVAIGVTFACLAISGCGGTDADHDAVSDANPDANPDAVSGGAWTDPATGLTWQTGSCASNVDAAQAAAYCDDLVLAGISDWRLPSISELRTLLRGCPDTQAGGSCGETDECPGVGTDCYDGDACMGCEWMEGPGKDGCYWPPEMDGLCDWYWSSTPSDNPVGYTCFVQFAAAHLSHDVDQNPMQHHALCVSGP